jgi:hypothetical protein
MAQALSGRKTWGAQAGKTLAVPLRRVTEASCQKRSMKSGLKLLISGG